MKLKRHGAVLLLLFSATLFAPDPVKVSIYINGGKTIEATLVETPITSPQGVVFEVTFKGGSLRVTQEVRNELVRLSQKYQDKPGFSVSRTTGGYIQANASPSLYLSESPRSNMPVFSSLNEVGLITSFSEFEREGGKPHNPPVKERGLFKYTKKMKFVSEVFIEERMNWGLPLVPAAQRFMLDFGYKIQGTRLQTMPVIVLPGTFRDPITKAEMVYFLEYGDWEKFRKGEDVIPIVRSVRKDVLRLPESESAWRLAKERYEVEKAKQAEDAPTEFQQSVDAFKREVEIPRPKRNFPNDNAAFLALIDGLPAVFKEELLAGRHTQQFGTEWLNRLAQYEESGTVVMDGFTMDKPANQVAAQKTGLWEMCMRGLAKLPLVGRFVPKNK